METVKKTAANVAASSKSGMDKTKATVQEKVDKIRAKDDFQKGLATERKDQRINEAELRKQMAHAHNLDEKVAHTGTGTGTGTYTATGVPGAGKGAHQMSPMPGHGTGQPTGGSHPIGGKGTGTNTSTTNTGLTGTGYTS